MARLSSYAARVLGLGTKGPEQLTSGKIAEKLTRMAGGVKGIQGSIGIAI